MLLKRYDFGIMDELDVYFIFYVFLSICKDMKGCI